MLTIKNEGIILEKTNLEFENGAVLNPGCVEVDGIVHMFYRAVRQGNFSTIGYCQLKDNKVIYRSDKPFFAPEHPYESHGLEDPRIVKHEDGNYYLFYTAFDGKNARVAYASSKDLKTFTKHDPVTPQMTLNQARDYFKDLPLKQKYVYYGLQTKQYYGQGEETLLWDKDVVMFPKKIRGKYALFHRVLPSIQIIRFESFDQLKSDEFWKDYFAKFEQQTVLNPRPSDEYIGAGCPPIETDKGWLLIYHRVIGKEKQRMYCAGAALLDINDPTKIVSKLKDPLFYPQESWEIVGDVNNVVFPTGAVVKDGMLTIYYGAADKLIAAKTLKLSELVETLADPAYSEIFEL